MATSVKIVPLTDRVLSSEIDTLIHTCFDRGLLDGIAVGIVSDGEAFFRFCGEGIGPHSRFEIGSITKVFTAELLSTLVSRKTLKLGDPVARFLSLRSSKYEGSAPITLIDLATHHSGLPRLPANLPRYSRNPYRSYTSDMLEAYLSHLSLQKPRDAGYLYSNLGYSLLGYVLGRAADSSYQELLNREILSKADMMQTSLALNGIEQPDLVPGHTQTGRPTEHWTFDAFAPCGGLCSTAVDLLHWIKWLLAQPSRDSMEPKALSPGGQIGLGWNLPSLGGVAWHNGGTWGFSSYLGLDCRNRTGVVVLSNRYTPVLINALGTRIWAILRGEQVLPLQGNFGTLRARLMETLQMTAQPILGHLARFR